VSIGDKDPEDAWDDGDPYDDRLRILERVVVELRARRDSRHHPRRLDALRLVDKLSRTRTDPRLDAVREALGGELAGDG